jgi:hypothetical protein
MQKFFKVLLIVGMAFGAVSANAASVDADRAFINAVAILQGPGLPEPLTSEEVRESIRGTQVSSNPDGRLFLSMKDFQNNGALTAAIARVYTVYNLDAPTVASMDFFGNVIEIKGFTRVVGDPDYVEHLGGFVWVYYAQEGVEPKQIYLKAEKSAGVSIMKGYWPVLRIHPRE